MSSGRDTGTNHYCPACKAAVDKVDSVCLNCEATRPPTGWPIDSFIGRTLSKKYRIDRRLSVGGFGMVFLATQVHQGEALGEVIIKMLHPEHAFDPVVTKRFINEGKAARSIVSPHVVKIFDMDFDQGNIPFMVQEFVEGQGLAEILEKQLSLSIPRAVSIALQVAEGMEEAHLQDIIHRDLKPENILVQRLKRTDFVKIIDFGIARVSNPDGLSTTSFVGTPRYMPPEQIKGKKLDGRADIYALGVILFEMITGRPPIKVEDSDLEYLTLNCTAQPDHLRQVEPGAPEALDRLIAAMIAKEPADRPASMREVAMELDQLSKTAGYRMEISGEMTIPPGASTATGSTMRELVSTPVSGDYEQQVRERRAQQSSEPFTQERPASGQHMRDEGSSVSLPVVAIAAGAGAMAVLVAAAVILVIVMSLRGRDEAQAPQPVRQPPSRVEQPPPPETPIPSEAEPDAGGTGHPASEPPVDTQQPAPPAPKPEEEPVTITPPAKTPPPGVDKKPPKKPGNPKPTKVNDNPWTKV
jgi:serine/threonine protein kinase